MACPTCDHTMQIIEGYDEPPTAWCPRCGTIKICSLDEIDVPKLPGRVREFLELLGDGQGTPVTDAAICFQALRHEAYRIGLYESCMPESERMP